MVSRLTLRVVETTGIEPATSGLQSRRSPQLSYVPEATPVYAASFPRLEGTSTPRAV